MKADKANQWLIDQDFPEYDLDYTRNGATLHAYTKQVPTEKTVAELVEQAVEIFNPEKIWLVPRKKNGNAPKRTAPIEIEFQETGPNEPVEGLNGLGTAGLHSAAIKAPPAVPAAAAPQGMTFSPQQYQTLASGFDSYKDYLIRDLEKKVNKYEAKLERNEEELEKLKREKFELEKNVAFKDKEFEIATQAKENEHGNTLNGFVSSLKDPESMEALAGLIKSVNEMRNPPQPQLGAAGAALPEGIDAEDLQDAYIQDLIVFMSRQQPEHRQRIHTLIQLLATGKVSIEEVFSLAEANTD